MQEENINFEEISKDETAHVEQSSSLFKQPIRGHFQSLYEVFTGRLLTKDEMIFIGNTILSNEQLVRRLVVLGWDTLEIHGENATYGCKWKLADHMETINLLNS